MKREDTLWGHGWGFRDTQFEVGRDGHVRLTGSRYDISGFSMPGFLPFCEDVLGVKLDTRELLEPVALRVERPNQNEPFCAAVRSEFSDDDYSFDDRVRAVHSHGQATADEVYQALYGRLARTVDMVFFCRSEQAALRITQLATEHDVCLIPYGGGTNVTGALTLPKDERRMIVSVDMRPLDEILWVNRGNRQACVQAGITGTALEQKLAEHGFTSGHEPDSQELSTLGGWISTNASGMKRNRYGAIENIVDSVTVVTPKGVLTTLGQFPRQSVGVQVKDVLFGSEGNFGLITKAVLRIRELPEVQAHQSLVFPDAEHGVAFLFELASSSLLPASIRLVDNLQFRFGLALKPAPDRRARLVSALQRALLQRVKHIDPSRMVVATIGMEGSAPEVRAQQAALRTLAARHRGFFAGASNGKRGYNLTFAIAYIRDFLTQLNVLGETLETTLPWDRLLSIVQRVQAEARQIHQDFSLPGKPFLSYRITQLYASGACVYFTYGAYMKGVANAGDVACQAEDRLRHTIVAAGGAVSNHHGVGKLRSELLATVLPPMHADVIRAIKHTVDPSNVFGARNGVFSTPFTQ